LHQNSKYKHLFIEDKGFWNWEMIEFFLQGVPKLIPLLENRQVVSEQQKETYKWITMQFDMERDSLLT
jgi:hypothetical protein